MSNVNHPKHYNTGQIEVIEYVQDSLSRDEFLGFIKGNVIKYLARANYKNGREDLEKAAWYLNYYLNNNEDALIKEEEDKTSSESVELELDIIELLKRLAADYEYMIRQGQNLFLGSQDTMCSHRSLVPGTVPVDLKDISFLTHEFMFLKDNCLYTILDILKHGKAVESTGILL